MTERAARYLYNSVSGLSSRSGLAEYIPGNYNWYFFLNIQRESYFSFLNTKKFQLKNKQKSPDFCKTTNVHSALTNTSSRFITRTSGLQHVQFLCYMNIHFSAEVRSRVSTTHFQVWKCYFSTEILMHRNEDLFILADISMRIRNLIFFIN